MRALTSVRVRSGLILPRESFLAALTRHWRWWLIGTVTNGRSYAREMGEWTRRDVRRLRRCEKRLGAMFSEAFALPPTRDTLELMRAIESAIVAANAILEKLDGGDENGK